MDQNPYGSPPQAIQAGPQRQLLPLIVTAVLILATPVAFCVGCLALYGPREQVARIELPRGRVLHVYAEGAFHYEPPGFVYCEILEAEQVVLPERPFMGVGSERTPSGWFDAITSGDENVGALVHNGDIVLMHRFSDSRTWPGPYGNVDADDYALGQELLQALGEKRGDRGCWKQHEYEVRPAN